MSLLILLPCDIVVATIVVATSQDKGFFIRDSTCTITTVSQWECGAIWERVEKLDFVLIPGTVSAVRGGKKKKLFFFSEKPRNSETPPPPLSNSEWPSFF